jgi:hypothetical protein
MLAVALTPLLAPPARFAFRLLVRYFAIALHRAIPAGAVRDALYRKR